MQEVLLKVVVMGFAVCIFLIVVSFIVMVISIRHNPNPLFNPLFGMLFSPKKHLNERGLSAHRWFVRAWIALFAFALIGKIFIEDYGKQ